MKIYSTAPKSTASLAISTNTFKSFASSSAVTESFKNWTSNWAGTSEIALLNSGTNSSLTSSLVVATSTNLSTLKIASSEYTCSYLSMYKNSLFLTNLIIS